MTACLRWLLLASVSAACAEAPPIEPWQVRAELQIVHLDAQRAVPLIARFTDDAPGAGEELRQLLANGSAKLVAHLIGRTSSEGKCETVQVQTIPYSIQMSPFDPDLIPKRKLRAMPESVHFPTSSFASRDVGSSIIIEPFVGLGGKLVSMLVTGNQEDFSGMQRFEVGVKADGTILHFEMPVFYSRKNTTKVFVRAGIPALLGSCILQSNKRVAELHVLTTHTRKLDGPLPGHSAKLQAPPQDSPPSDMDFPVRTARIELHRFIVPQVDALRLRAALLDSTKVESAFSSLLAGTKAGRVELAGILSSPLENGVPAEFKNSRRQYYGTEFSGACFGPPPPRSAIDGNPPTVFEIREVGENLETEIAIDSTGEQVALRFVSKSSAQNGFTRWPTGANTRSQTEHDYNYPPNFTHLATDSNIVLMNRQRTLFRFQKLPAPDGRVEIALIRAVTEHFSQDPKP